MCGLFAFFSTTTSGHQGPELSQRAHRALDAQAHRGPDGRGVWLSRDRSVALGHVRLAIIATDDGAQPLSSERGDITAVVAGEFYGFEALRRELAGRGHRFSTGSDSEVLIHLYEEKGPDCLERLRGEFAFVLWDEPRRRLFAARDRFGVKPLCFARTPEGLSFASEAKGLFAAGIPARWNRRSFLHAIRHQYLPPGRTLFDGVQTLCPGRFLLGPPEEPREHLYWDIDFPRLQLDQQDQPDQPDPQAYLASESRELRYRFEEAVKDRLRADTPLATCLSGGLDSSAVTALAAAHSPAPLTCFGVTFDTPDYDEQPHAEEVARHLGVHYHPVQVTSRDLVDHLPEAVRLSEGLAINGHLPAKYLLSRAIRDAGFKVVLTGEGADEALAGYPHFLHDLPGPVTQSNTDHHSAALCRGVMLPQDRSSPAQEIPAITAHLGNTPTFLRAKAAIGDRLLPLLHPDLREAATEHDLFADLLDHFDLPGRLHDRHPVDQAAYLWSRLALSGYILRTLGDGTEMAHGVEGRTPFLDHRFFEVAQTLPVSLKIRDGLEKWIFRHAVEDLLPPATLARRKQPFLAPPLDLEDLLRAQPLDASSLFDPKPVHALLDELPRMTAPQRRAAEPILMTVLTATLLDQTLALESPR